MVEFDDKGGKYAWRVLSKTLAYAASLVPEITDNIVNVDLAMKNGFLWKKGPFEMLDEFGPSWFRSKISDEGLSVPQILELVGEGSFFQENEKGKSFFETGGKYTELVRPKGYLSAADVKKGKIALFSNSSASPQ